MGRRGGRGSVTEHDVADSLASLTPTSSCSSLRNRKRDAVNETRSSGRDTNQDDDREKATLLPAWEVADRHATVGLAWSSLTWAWFWSLTLLSFASRFHLLSFPSQVVYATSVQRQFIRDTQV